MQFSLEHAKYINDINIVSTIVQLQYLRHVRAKHEARRIVVSGVVNPVQVGDANSSTILIGNANNNCITSNNNKNSTNNLGPLGKYLELLHNS